MAIMLSFRKYSNSLCIVLPHPQATVPALDYQTSVEPSVRPPINTDRSRIGCDPFGNESAHHTGRRTPTKMGVALGVTLWGLHAGPDAALRFREALAAAWNSVFCSFGPTSWI